MNTRNFKESRESREKNMEKLDWEGIFWRGRDKFRRWR